MRNEGRWSGIVLAAGILLSLLSGYAADRFERDRRFREAHGRAEQVLEHAKQRLAEYEAVVRGFHSRAANSLTNHIFPVPGDPPPPERYPGLRRVQSLREGCGDPAAVPEESASLVPEAGRAELLWRLPVYRVGVPLETPEQRRAGCIGRVEAQFDPEPLLAHLFDDPRMAGLTVQEVALIRREGGSTGVIPLKAPFIGESLPLGEEEIRFLGQDLAVRLAATAIPGRLGSGRWWGLAVSGSGLLAVLALFRLLRTRYERRLAETERALDRYARIAAMGEMAAAIAHELAQPLTGTLAGLEALRLRAEQDGPAGAALADGLRRVLRHAERAADILDDIRRQAGAAEGRRDPQPLEVRQTLRRVAELAGLDGRFRAVRISVLAGTEDLRVTASRIGLESVLLNLVRNGAEAILETGRSGAVVLSAVRDGDRAVLGVLDDGPGLPDPAQMFRPFHSLKAGGMGLGLCYAKRMVESWGGTLRGGNRPEGGAFMEINLPLADSPC